MVGGVSTTSVGIESLSSDPYNTNRLNNKARTNTNIENERINIIKWLIVSVCTFGFFLCLWKSQDATTLNATMSSLSFSSSPKTADRNTRTSQVDSSSNAVRVADAKTQKKTKEPIQQISFLGERNSGTRWLFE